PEQSLQGVRSELRSGCQHAAAHGGNERRRDCYRRRFQKAGRQFLFRREQLFYFMAQRGITRTVPVEKRRTLRYFHLEGAREEIANVAPALRGHACSSARSLIASCSLISARRPSTRIQPSAENSMKGCPKPALLFP